MNTSSLVKISKFRKNGLKFLPLSEGRNYELFIELAALFERGERNGYRIFALDLSRISHLTEEMTALILETTTRLRRRGGELFIFNLHSRLQEDLSAFNPHAYLAIAEIRNAPPEYIPPESGLVVNSQEESSTTPASEGFRKTVSEIRIPYSEDEVYRACDFVVKEAKALGFSDSELSRIKIAVYEACLNAVQHSNKAGVDEDMLVEVEKIGNTMNINVHDKGRGFNLEKALEYDATEAASHRKTGGMGLHIIRKAMDKVDYKMDPIDGNKLIMTKHLQK